MKPEQVVRHFGCQSFVADALGITRQTVHLWVKRNHVPVVRQMQIEEMTKGALKVDPREWESVLDVREGRRARRLAQREQARLYQQRLRDARKAAQKAAAVVDRRLQEVIG